MNWFTNLIQKFNPAQRQISEQSGDSGTTQLITPLIAFKDIESVNRGVNMITKACSSLDYDVKDKVIDPVVSIRGNTLNKLLNFRPNPYQSAHDFRLALFTDYILEGNAFIYYDGAFMYHLPANQVVIHSDPKTFVAGYTYAGVTELSADEVIHFKDVSSTSIYRGDSRLNSCRDTLGILKEMLRYQKGFFENGTVAGLVFQTDNSLGPQAKEKTIKQWQAQYSPRGGGRRPMILDNGLKLTQMGQADFKELDFDQSMKSHNIKILNALGVPEVLFSGGNNANISPNLRLFYLETVLPIVRTYVSAIERYFGYDVEPVTNNVSALQPELRDLSGYLGALVNGGIITPNEAREELRYEKKPGGDEIRIPVNIAGSAVDPSQGGAPKKPKNEETPKNGD